MQVRSLLWLFAVVALLVPSFVGPAAALDRMDRPTMSDCDHDASPPPCPDKGTAKHAAGLCCPLMSCALALLPPAAPAAKGRLSAPFISTTAAHLIGLSLHKDPPPPRV
jgi:hypothetical protein